MQHLLHPGGKFGPVDNGQKPSISKLRKLLNGVEERGVRERVKGHHPLMGFKPGCDWEWWNATLSNICNFNQLFLSSNGIKYRRYVSVHNMNSCSV